MSWPLAALGDIAPAKPIKLNGYTSSDRIWHVTLDQIESNTGLLLEKSIKPLSEAGSSTHAFDDRHVLYSKLRPYLNKVLLPNEVGLGTTELVPMLPASGKLDRVYLAHYLKSKTFVNWISSQTAGAKMPRVSMNTFWEHEIPLPPLAEQKRIAAILDKADSLRRKNQQAIQLADQFLRAAFLDMFGDPVTNPKKWEVKKLKEMSHIQIGPFGTQLHKEDYIEGGIPLINPTHIVNGKIVSNMNYTIPSNKHAELDEYHLKAGDIIMGRRGEMGRCAVVTEQENGWLCGTGSLFIRTYNAEIFAEYLCTLLSGKTIKSYLEAESQGATMSNLNKTIVGNINIPVPSENALKKYSIIQEKIMKNINKMDCFSGELLFNSLSQKAFAGKL